MTRDFYREFLEQLDEQLDRFVSEAQRIEPRAFAAGEASAKKAVQNALCSQLILNGCREAYNEERKKGVPAEEAAENLYRTHLEPLLPRPGQASGTLRPYKGDALDFLQPYCGATVVLCKNERQLRYWRPYLERRTEPTLLLVDFAVPDDAPELPDCITALELGFWAHKAVENGYLERIVPRVYAYANLFAVLFQRLRPTEVWVLEGCHEEAAVLASLAAAHGVESVCVQQGWPSVLYTRFRDMEYTRFWTWGQRFNELWQAYNPAVRFEAKGYLYSVAEEKRGNDVTFFLQAPIIISDPTYFDELLQLAEAVADRCPDRTVRVRPHPEWPLNEGQQRRLAVYPNVETDSAMPLVEVFARTEVSVSIFSSTIVESLAHGAIPVVYDPSLSGAPYYPPLDGVGLTTYSLPEATAALCALLVEPPQRDRLRTRMAAERAKLFTDFRA